MVRLRFNGKPNATGRGFERKSVHLRTPRAHTTPIDARRVPEFATIEPSVCMYAHSRIDNLQLDGNVVPSVTTHGIGLDRQRHPDPPSCRAAYTADGQQRCRESFFSSRSPCDRIRLVVHPHLGGGRSARDPSRSPTFPRRPYANRVS